MAVSVELVVRCDSDKPTRVAQAAKDSCDVFLAQIADLVGHSVSHAIPFPGVAIVEIDDEAAIAYMQQFSLRIVKSLRVLEECESASSGE